MCGVWIASWADEEQYRGKDNLARGGVLVLVWVVLVKVRLVDPLLMRISSLNSILKSQDSIQVLNLALGG